MNYGKALKLARALANLSQKELARKAGLDPSHISLIEKGTRRPSLTALERLSSALQIPSDLLLLMAAEKDDLKFRDPEQIQQAAESLARLVLLYGPRKRSSRRRGRALAKA
jgi:transcriptional regulator with XRE-family HTH domain